MSDNPKSRSQAVALIKFFSREDHYLSFKKGTNLFRTPHYYRKDKSIGRGDRSESCLGYWDKQLGDEMPNIIHNGDKVNFDDAESILVYPAAEQKDAWLQSWAVIGPHNNFENSLEQMLNEFGTYFVILPATKISAYRHLLAKASGCKVHMGGVKYSDNPLERSLVVKDSKLSYQKEFRFLLGECSKGEERDKKIQLQGMDKMLLEASSLKLTSPSGDVKYCSLGHQKVVSVSK
ncbi:hypothetical protein [Psychromonas aquatilis]|uniref:Uncharacterized protein n=1 Tax=Psychromonas aquatilis TaxID=2005072 RepID=A0ABU9GUC1_9GAMM